MKFVATIALFLLSIVQVKSQQVVIAGHIPDCPDSLPVFLYQQIGQHYNATVKDAVGIVKNGKFKLAIPLAESAFLILENKCFKSTLYVSPGDSVFIETKEQNRPVYSGNNAAGHDFYNNHRPFTGDRTINDVDSILTNATSPAEAIQSFRHLITGYTAPLLKPLAADNISQSFYNSMVSAAESFIIFIVGNQILINLDPTYTRKSTKLSDEQLKLLLRDFFSLYDPFNKKYIGAPTAYVADLMKCNSIQLNIINGEKTKIDHWKSFTDAYDKYIYAPLPHLEMILGSSLLSNMENKFSDKDMTADMLNTFKLQFPQSPYLIVLEKLFKEYGNDMAAEDSGQYLGRYNTATGKLTPITLNSKIASLNSLIKKHFPGKAVFVDLWATWCSPCKAEFKYEDKLQEYLTNHSIETLYITFDFKRNKENWKKFVGDYKLRGYHFFPNETFKTAIKKMLKEDVLGIPRYLLYDKHGNLVIAQAFRPSSGEHLYNQINQKLHTGQ